MISAFGVAVTKTAEHCVQHNRPRCGVEGCKGKWIGPNDSGKKTIADASPSGLKRTTVQSPPAQANPPSGGSRGSRKRVRYLHVVPTAKRAVTLPEIKGPQSSVKRDSSVKSEVQISL